MQQGDLVGSFYDAIRPIIFVVQFFGILPVNVWSSNQLSRVTFKWKSLKSIYSILLIIFGLIKLIFLLRFTIIHGISLGYVSLLSFYLASLLGSCCFFKLAIKWKQLMKLWFESEKVFLKTPYTVRGQSLKMRLRVWAAGIGFLALSKVTSMHDVT